MAESRVVRVGAVSAGMFSAPTRQWWFRKNRLHWKYRRLGSNISAGWWGYMDPRVRFSVGHTAFRANRGLAWRRMR